MCVFVGGGGVLSEQLCSVPQSASCVRVYLLCSAGEFLSFAVTAGYISHTQLLTGLYKYALPEAYGSSMLFTLLQGPEVTGTESTLLSLFLSWE